MEINAATRLKTKFRFKLTLGDTHSQGVVSFEVETTSKDKAWLQLLKEHKTLLPHLLKIELIS